MGGARMRGAVHPIMRNSRSRLAPPLGRRRAANAPAQAAGARRRVLVLCLGGIGDTVLAFGALRDLRRACPHDHLTVVAMWRQSAELLSDLGIFDEVLQHNF